MIIIAWLLIVLTTPVSVAAGAPSPVADVAPACNLGGSSADDAMRPIGHSGFSPRDFGRTPDGT
jgi:hypothetical protein